MPNAFQQNAFQDDAFQIEGVILPQPPEPEVVVVAGRRSRSRPLVSMPWAWWRYNQPEPIEEIRLPRIYEYIAKGQLELSTEFSADASHTIFRREFVSASKELEFSELSAEAVAPSFVYSAVSEFTETKLSLKSSTFKVKNWEARVGLPNWPKMSASKEFYDWQEMAESAIREQEEAILLGL